MSSGPRLLMIAMDSFPPELLDVWCNDGSLPNLAALRKDAAYGYIESVGDLFPGAVWTTFSSASLPTTHGIFHFMQWDPGTMSFRRPGPTWCDYTPFWHKLASQGVPVIAFDLPFSFAKPAPALVVEAHGWGLHDELAPGFSRPADLLARINAAHKSALRPDVLGPRSDRQLKRELDGVIASVEERTAVIEELAEAFEWRFMLAVFAETHRAGHYFWGNRVTGTPRGGIKSTAAAFDRVLPRLRTLCGPDDVFVVFSVHGMGPYDDFDKFSEGLSEYLEPSVSAARRFNPVSILHRHLPAGLRYALSSSFPTPVRDRLFSHHLGATKDWSKVKTIFNPPDGYIYVRANTTGREKLGSLEPAAAQEHLRRLEATFAGIRTPEGRPAIKEIVRPVERYGAGVRAQNLPDLVLRGLPPHTSNTLLMPDGSVIRASPWRGNRDGDHTQLGFYLRAGGSRASQPLSLKSHDFAAAMLAEVGLELG